MCRIIAWCGWHARGLAIVAGLFAAYGMVSALLFGGWDGLIATLVVVALPIGVPLALAVRGARLVNAGADALFRDATAELIADSTRRLGAHFRQESARLVTVSRGSSFLIKPAVHHEQAPLACSIREGVEQCDKSS